MLTEVLAEKLLLAAPNMLEELFPPKVFEVLKAEVLAPNCPKAACWLPRDWMGGPAWAVPDNEREQCSVFSAGWLLIMETRNGNNTVGTC